MARPRRGKARQPQSHHQPPALWPAPPKPGKGQELGTDAPDRRGRDVPSSVGGKGFQHLEPNLNCGAMSRLWRENMRSIWKNVCPDVPFDGFINSLCQMGELHSKVERGSAEAPQALPEKDLHGQ